MSNAQELYQVANDLDKDELVSLLVEAQMKNEQLKQKLEDETCWEEFQEVMDKLKEQNKKLKEEKVDVDEYNELKEYCDKWSPILSDIDGDDFCNLLCDYGWEYNEENELVRSED